MENLIHFLYYSFFDLQNYDHSGSGALTVEDILGNKHA